MMNTKTILKMLGIIAAAGIIMLAATSCIKIVGIRGSGDVTSETRSVASFDSISISSGMNLYLNQGDSESLRIEAEDNILPMIIAAVENGRLEIKYKNFLIGGLNLSKPVNVYLTVKDLKEIDVSSGVRIQSEEIKTDSLKIDLSSGAEGIMIIKSRDLAVGLSSGSSLEISGQTDSQDIDLGSGAEYGAKDFISKTTVVNASSGSTAIVNVSESLDIKISSGATVEYAGSPKIVSDISSGGVLRSISN